MTTAAVIPSPNPSVVANSAATFSDTQGPAVDSAYSTSNGSWVGFLDALGKMEGNGNYGALGKTKTYAGLYQFGDQLLTGDSTNPGLNFYNGIGGQLLGVTSQSQYLRNPIAQEVSAIMEFSGIPDIGTNFLSRYAYIVAAFTGGTGFTSGDLNQLVNPPLGKPFTINYTDTSNKVVYTDTVSFTPAGLSAAGHLVGQGAVADALMEIWNQCFDPNTGKQISTTANLELTPALHYDKKHNRYYYSYSYTDGNSVPFSTYAGLLGKFNIDDLLNAEKSASTSGATDHGVSQLNGLLQSLITYHRKKISAYMNANHQDLVMNMSQAYKGTILSVLQGLGVNNQLIPQYIDSITGKVILPSDFFASVPPDQTRVNRSNDSTGNLIVGGNSKLELLTGSATGNNVLIAGSGSDYLTGGSGSDTLVSGSGFDILEGGGGANTYNILTPRSGAAVSAAPIKIRNPGSGLAMMHDSGSCG